MINLNLPAKSDGTTIRQHTDDLLERAKLLFKLGYIKEEHLLNLLVDSCEYHDYGKCNPYFQERLKNNTKFDYKLEVPHNILSVFFINKKDFENVDDYLIVFNAVLNHHAYTNNLDFIYTYLKDNTSKEFKKVQKNLIDATTYFNPKTRFLNQLCETSTNTNSIIVKGLLHKCDYSASASIPIEFPNDFLKSSMNNLLDTWKQNNIATSFNDLQLFCQENTNNNLIITAPTGMGKTEASLLWVGNNKSFYILPMKTAINAMYNRFTEQILNNTNIDERLSLLHSESISYLLENNSNKSELDVFTYNSLSKHFSLPLTICTPDQLFNFVFMYRGYELKLAILSYSKIIIDEIQSYSADILAYIIYGIRKIVEVGGKFAIVTATLPPFVKTLIDDSLSKVNNNNNQYVSKEFTHNIIRHNVKVLDELILSQSSIELIASTFNNNLNTNSENNKILVVCNTVKNTQALFDALASKVDERYINIFHAKFTQKDRANLEENILSDGLSNTKKSIIWITTQVVEASIDIDFDYVFTELSDLNSLFQRLGRCNRKAFKPVDNYNCFIFTKRNAMFIDNTIFKLSKEAISGVDGILDESTKISLLNTYFTYENIKKSNFIELFDLKMNYLENIYNGEVSVDEINKNFRNIASTTIIPLDIYENHKHEFDLHESLLNSSFDEFIKNNPNLTKKQFVEQKELSRKFIKDYSISVNTGDVNRKLLSKQLIINHFEKILVIKCIYDKKGFSKLDDNNAIAQSGEFL